MDQLKRFRLSCTVPSGKKEVFAVGDGKGLEGVFCRPEQLFVGSRSVAAEDLFDLAPVGLDGIEIRGIGRHVQQTGADGLDDLTDFLDLVGGQIVQDDYIPGAQGGHQPLRHSGQKHFAVHGAFNKPRGTGTLQANTGD